MDSPERVREIDIIGSKATAKIQAITQEITIFEGSNEGKKLTITENNTLGDELRHFIDALKNKTTLSNNGEIGAKTVELIEKTKKSQKLGKTIIL